MVFSPGFPGEIPLVIPSNESHIDQNSSSGPLVEVNMAALDEVGSVISVARNRERHLHGRVREDMAEAWAALSGGRPKERERNI